MLCADLQSELQVEPSLEDRAQHLPSLLPGIRPWTIAAREAKKKYREIFKKNGAIFSADLVSFSTTFSPQSHHVLPPKYHVLRTTIPQNPL